MANTTWSTTDKTAGVTLTGSNLIASNTTTVVNQVRAIDKQITGKFYWECTYTTIAGTLVGAGICNAAFVLPSTVSAPNTALGSCVLVKGGTLYVDGTSQGLPFGTITAGTVVCIAVDVAARLIWFRLGAAGNWNTSASANPATGNGGVDFTSMGDGIPLYPFATFSSSANDKITANFGGSAFSGTVPSGFTSGFTAGTTSPTNALVTQAAIEEWYSTAAAAQVTQVAIEEWGVLPPPPLWVTQAGAFPWVVYNHPPVVIQITQTGAFAWVDTSHPVASPIGVFGTGGVGTVAIANLSINASITGLETDTSLGTLTFAIDASVHITGVETDTAIGSFAFELDTAVTLTGVSSVGSAGRTIPEIDIAITGVQVSTNVGIPTTEITFLNGVSITTGIGVPTPANDVVVIVIGEQVNTGIGVVIPRITMPPLVEVRITGLPITASIGDVTPHVIGNTITGGTITGGEITTGIGQPIVVSFIGGMAIDDLIVTQGVVIEEDTMVSLRWSDTDGNTWGDPVHRSLGLTGDYLNSLQWQRLGMARHGRVFEIAWSAPVPTCLLGAHIKFSAARS